MATLPRNSTMIGTLNKGKLFLNNSELWQENKYIMYTIFDNVKVAIKLTKFKFDKKKKSTWVFIFRLGLELVGIPLKLSAVQIKINNN